MIRTETRTAGRKGHRADTGGAGRGSPIMATQQSRSAAAQCRVPGPELLLAAASSSALFLSSPFQTQVEKHDSLICHKPTKVPSWTLVFTTWNVFLSAPSGHRNGFRQGGELKSPQRPTNKKQSSLCVSGLCGNKGQCAELSYGPGQLTRPWS